MSESTLTQRLQRRFFRSEDHPYRHYEAEIARQRRPESTLLDAGCGRGAPLTRGCSSRRRLASRCACRIAPTSALIASSIDVMCFVKQSNPIQIGMLMLQI